MGVIQKICGFTFGVGLFLGSFLGIVFLTTPFLPLMILKPKWYRQILDEMVGSWEVFAAGMLELILGIKVVVTGDAIRPNERSLIVMNHRTRLDWMYLWSCLIRYGSLKNEKIILKSPLKHIPGAGWAMQCAAYIFIDRKWETDKTILTTILNYFRDLGHNTMILIFPEGTDLTERTKKKSDEFAEKNNWEKYDHVLHPRTTGFTFLAELMQKDGMLDAIYDITVGYPYSFPQNETGLFFGEIPKEVHFHVNRHSSVTLPLTEKGLETWCRNRWAEKEKTLKEFYQYKTFDRENKLTSSKQRDARPILIMALIYWTLFIISISAMLYYSMIAKLFLLGSSIFYILQPKLFQGFEFLVIKMFNKFYQSKKKEN